MATKRVERTVTETVAVCDRCGREVGNLWVCVVCDDDVCYLCRERVGGHSCCKICADLGKPILEKMDVLAETYDHERSVLWNEWRAEAAHARKVAETANAARGTDEGG